jgi:hypothetical protein
MFDEKNCRGAGLLLLLLLGDYPRLRTDLGILLSHLKLVFGLTGFSKYYKMVPVALLPYLVALI